MPWSLEVTRPARKDLEGLPAHDRTAVVEAIDRLLNDPGGADIKKLGGSEWRLRVGRWRVRFEMDNQAGLLRILRVLARKEAYR
jgi:mRNA interferase RelE/StbE